MTDVTSHMLNGSNLKRKSETNKCLKGCGEIGTHTFSVRIYNHAGSEKNSLTQWFYKLSLKLPRDSEIPLM